MQTALVKSKAGSRPVKLGRARHRPGPWVTGPLSWLDEGIDVGFVGHTVMANYQKDRNRLVLGLRPETTA